MSLHVFINLFFCFFLLTRESRCLSVVRLLLSLSLSASVREYYDDYDEEDCDEEVDVGKEVGVSMILFLFLCILTAFFRRLMTRVTVLDLRRLLVVSFFLLPLTFRRIIVRFTLGLFLIDGRLPLLASALLAFMANATPAAVTRSPTDAPFAVNRFIATCSSFLSAKYLSPASVDWYSMSCSLHAQSSGFMPSSPLASRSSKHVPVSNKVIFCV